MPEPATELSDSELVARFYGCSAAAFDELVERWWKRLIGFFSHRGFPAEDAEDLALQTLVKLAATKETLDGPRFNTSRPVAPFLLTIARNLAIQRWRSREAPVTNLEECAEVAQPPGDSLPEGTLHDLLQCIDALPELERTYVLLCGKHGLGDMSHTEIGQHLDRWPAQITELSQRTRSRLKGCMAGKGYR